jgi:hypothetical protein
VPVASLSAALELKDSKAAQTTAFKNVFDSLSLFEDLEQESSAKQEDAALLNSSPKKELVPDSSSGTGEAVVLQTPAPNLAKPPLALSPSAMLPQAVQAKAPENSEILEVTPALQAAPPREQSDVKTPATTVRQLASLSEQPSLQPVIDARPAPIASPSQAPAVPLRYAVLPDKPEVVPAATLARAPVTGRPSGTQETTATLRSISKPSVAESVSIQPPPRPAEPAPAQPAPVQPVQETAIRVQAAPPDQPAHTGKPNSAKVSIASTPERNAPVAAPQRAPQTKTASQIAPAVAQPLQRVAVDKPAATKLAAAPNAAVSTPSVNRPPVVAATPVRPSVAPQPPAPVSAPVAPGDPPRERPAERTVSTPTPELTPPAPLAASQSLSTAPPAAGIVPESEPASLSVPQREGPALSPAPKIPLLPQAQNFAFAIRMLGLDSSSSHLSLTQPKTSVTTNEAPVTQPKGQVSQPQSPGAQQTEAPSVQAANTPRRETQSSVPEIQKTASSSPSEVRDVQQAPSAITHWNEGIALHGPEAGIIGTAPEPAEAVHSTLPVAAQEARLLTPELPRSSASSEILLHLTGNDQSSAAIRVADRAGSVNVSVHASDPVLRESLRSNLGELSTQLNAQGFKADTIKSTAVTTHAEAQQDSHASGQRGSQQQSSTADRQPQRDRRGNGGQWQQELDQQITGGDAHPGGNR